MATTLAIAGLLCSQLATVAPAGASPSCSYWRVSPVFRAVQTNGYTVTFTLRQYGRRLSGTASYTQTNPSKNIFGQSTATTTYGEIIAGSSSQMSGSRFTTRVRWSNGAIGNYSGYVWFVSPSGRGLYANLKGTTYPDGGGALVNWQTNSGLGQTKPVVCLAANTAGY